MQGTTNTSTSLPSSGSKWTLSSDVEDPVPSSDGGQSERFSLLETSGELPGRLGATLLRRKNCAEWREEE